MTKQLLPSATQDPQFIPQNHPSSHMTALLSHSDILEWWIIKMHCSLLMHKWKFCHYLLTLISIWLSLLCPSEICIFVVCFWKSLMLTEAAFIGSNIQNKIVVLWNIFTVEKKCFLFYYSIKCNLFVWWQSWIFSSWITPVFSITWSLRNHSNVLIWCPKAFLILFSMLKPWYVFLRILWVESKN